MSSIFPQSSLLIGSDDWGRWQMVTSIKNGGRHPFGMARLLPKKIKRELCNQGEEFLNFNYF